MELFQNWIVSVCGATVIISFLKIFVGNTTVKKSFNTFMAIFLIFYTVMPLKNVDNKAIDITYYEDEDNFQEYTVEGYNKIIEETVKDICNENNVKVLGFNITSYIDNEDSFFVKLLVVDIDNNEKIDVIKNDITEQTGFEVVVE